MTRKTRSRNRKSRCPREKDPGAMIRRDFLKVGRGILAGSLLHPHGCGGKGSSQDGHNEGAADTGGPADGGVTDGGATDGAPGADDDYLVLANAAGLGTFERGDPWQQPLGSGYSTIQYIRRDI